VKPTLILAGGGTGGHVFPLVAIARELEELWPEGRLLFVGTNRGMESRFVPAQGYELELLNVLPMRGSGPAGFLRGAARAAKLLPDSFALLKRSGALGVLSVGGYAAGPVSLSAYLAGLPLALVEPNSVMGLANRLIAPFVDRAYLAFPEAETALAPEKVRMLGVPIRRGFSPVPLPPLGVPRLLVLGGSQGARALNETVPRALGQVTEEFRVVHQCGAASVPTVLGQYQAALGEERAQRSVTVVPFIDDVALAISEAHLLIARSGAGAVSEIAAVGRPSILVPYPYASGDHQAVNARSLERRAAATVVTDREATPDRIAAAVLGYLRNPLRLHAAAAAAAQLGKPGAARQIAQDFLHLVKEAP
jgi:UDP-N-acetylglucosamine--N-acetylmuramyl-(pentapeptide) pyrophosphoryl-undecaprenol N-acetylglucosamine transferase